jgi:hypothetical protein
MKLKKGLSIFLILNQMCFLLLISQIILGQNFIIKVIDSSTSSPIPFASINYKNQKKATVQTKMDFSINQSQRI